MTYLLNSYIKILERDLYLERSFLGQTRLESMESNTARKCFLNKTYKKILLNKTIQNAPFRHYQISKFFQKFEPEMMNIFIFLFWQRFSLFRSLPRNYPFWVFSLHTLNSQYLLYEYSI